VQFLEGIKQENEMTDQQIRLVCGELNAGEMRLARALCGYYERNNWNKKEKFMFLHKYSDWLAKHGFLDKDWWTHQPNAVTRFIDEDSDIFQKKTVACF
jgi:hypothetical protein